MIYPLVPQALYHELRPRAQRITFSGVLPAQPNSLAGVLCIAWRPGSVWVVEPRGGFKAWLRGVKPSLPVVPPYPLADETGIRWLNQRAQQLGLALHERILPANTWQPDAFPGVQIAAFATTKSDLSRVWLLRTDVVGGFEGVTDIRAGVQSLAVSLSRSEERLRAARKLRDEFRATSGKKLIIESSGVSWK